MEQNKRSILYFISAFMVCGFFVLVYVWAGAKSSFCVRGLLQYAPVSCEVKFNSPDETANNFFIEKFARSEELYYKEPLNLIGNNLIHPRSMNVVGDRVVPGSFLGIIFVYGWIARILGEWVIPWLTPIFAVFGVIFFWLFTARIFGRPVGLISALLMSTLAPWWYFASRGMYHNVLFVSLLIAGMYFLHVFLSRSRGESSSMNYSLLLNSSGSGSAEHHNSASAELASIHDRLPYASDHDGHSLTKACSDSPRSHNDDALPIKSIMSFGGMGGGMLAGFFIGLALITRTSEVGWVGALVGFVLFLNIKKLYWPGIIVFLAALSAMFVPVISSNYILYGSPFSVGYQTVGSGGGIDQLIGENGATGIWKLLFVPFGFDWGQFSSIVKNYLLSIFWWWAAAVGAGFVYWVLQYKKLNRNLRKRQLAYVAGYLLLVAGILLFYASWGITDRIDRDQVSIGTSFVRYFLPIYIGGLPFAAFAVYRLTRVRRWWRQIFLVLLVLFVISYPSYRLVMFDTDESLATVRDNIISYQKKSEEFQEILPKDSVYIVYPQLDKVLFPQRRRMITDLAVGRDYEAVRDILTTYDVFYVTFGTPEYVRKVSLRDFEPYGMRIVDGKRLNDFDWVYRLEEEGG